METFGRGRWHGRETVPQQGARPITFGTGFMLSFESLAWRVMSYAGRCVGGRVGLRGAEEGRGFW